jgi:sugar/nucleoside kinase (ribokinase family)
MSTIGLGNALVDIMLKLESDDSLADVGIAKGAMNMIDNNQTKEIHRMLAHLDRSLSPGGSVCNAMRAFGLLGGRSGFFGKIGTDELGDFYERALLSAGVKPYFVREPGITGCCTVMISPDGERTMGTFLGPAPTLTPSDISEDIIKRYDYMYIEGYMVVNEPLIRAAMEKACRLGVKVVLDLSNFNIVNAFKSTFRSLIDEHVSILFANETEIEAFTGMAAANAVDFMAPQVETMVVTLGKKGSVIARGSERVRIEAYGPPVPLDTTGAGDHFAAGFLFGQSCKAGLEQSGRIGSLLAGHVISVIGPQIPEGEWESVRAKVKEILS